MFAYDETVSLNVSEMTMTANVTTVMNVTYEETASRMRM